MFDSSELLEMLMWALIPATLYAIVLWLFDPQRPKILHMALLFLIGSILLIPCYLTEYVMDIAFPWGSPGHLMLNILPSAILEEGAKLLYLAFDTKMAAEGDPTLPESPWSGRKGVHRIEQYV